KLGKLFYVENRTQSQGFSPGVVQYPWFDVDVGFSSYPAAYDVNGDGLEDLLIGEEIGNINLLINTGTASEPQFDPDPESGMNEKNFGLIDARQGQVIFGFSAPTITRSWTTDYLLVGTASGNILSYRLTNGQPQLRDDHAFSSLRDGHRSKIQLADINGDGYLEGFTGNSRGGVVLYRSSILVDEVLSTPQISPWQVRLSPNPTTEVLTISHQSLQPLQLIIFDSKGVSLVAETVRTSQADLSLQAFPSGVYFLQVGDRSDRRTFRFVKL
ncbi:MAG: T9SS type A sorting domain-containing protein, partial [Saprospiraceae bacterium]|nr:T9SS type A sorting domain-containing protein [Saprospiraceae bacterium]